MLRALRDHWPDYLIEGTCLGLFMLATAGIVILVDSSASPFLQWMPDPVIRRIPIGVGVGLVAIAIIYSPWGKRSGAHINPAVTLTFFRLGKLAAWDACFYILAQFIGGWLGVLAAAALWHRLFTEPPVHYVVTVPGTGGWLLALITEFCLALGLMLVILFSSNQPRFSQYTGFFAGCLVASYIIFTVPISGMSINPARTFASALPAQVWTSFWIYYFAPPLGMLTAAELYLNITHRNPKTLCGKLCPNRETPCPCRNCCCDQG
jgi:aquaporin Z